MRLALLAIVGTASFLSSSASGQCRLDSHGFGIGAVDRGRAVLSEMPANYTPGVRFFAKSASGWQSEDSFVLGDTVAIYDSPVAIDGDRAIAGTPESNAQGGKAFVFDRVGTQWIETALIPSTYQPGDFFGSVVALDGDVAVVGADHWILGGGDGLSRIHVFELQSGSWSEVAQDLIHPSCVAVQGSTIAVGDDDTAPGRVRLYRRAGGSWGFMQEFQGSGGCSIGSAIALEGDTLAVGAAFHSGGGGYVEIYRRQGGLWSFDQHIVPSLSANGDQFGCSVALSGTSLLVGSRALSGSGRVYRFEQQGAAYAEVMIFGPPPGVSSFGHSVSLYREDAVIGGFQDVAFYRLGFAEASEFCPATPNSTGSAAELAPAGCDSLSGASLSLVSRNLPPGVLGLVHFGTNTVQQPFGDGTLCIGSPFRRLPAALADPSGTLVHDVDFASGSGSVIEAGRTWKFQTLYRDPGSASSGLNLTNALSIRITP